jgi:DNA polymerase-3 subunit gamma/tau
MCLALKYRPHSFDDLVGQRVVSLVLAQMVRKHAVPPALLLAGSRGSGKTSSARILGAALTCEMSPEPCGTCLSCQAVFAGMSLDVLELDGATHGLVADIREVCESVRYTLSGRGRMVVLDEAQSLSPEAFNALLTTLESPPPGVVFVLVTTEPRRLPDTIVSRCMQLEFRRIALTDIVARLEAVCAAENLDLEASLLRTIAERAEGGLRDALMLLDQLARIGITTQAQFTELMGESDFAPTLLESLRGGDPATAFTIIDEQLYRTGDPTAVTTALVHCLKDVTALHAGGDITSQGQPLVDRQRLARLLSPDQLFTGFRVLWDVQTKIRVGDDRRTALELATAMLAGVWAPAESRPAPAATLSAAALSSHLIAAPATTPPVSEPDMRLTLAQIAAMHERPHR